MNKLLVMSGVPGSGKSYISLLISNKKRNEHVYIVSSDKLRAQIGGHQQNFSNDDLMWKMYYEFVKTYSLDKNGIVILDSTNSKVKFRIDKVKPYKNSFDEIDLIFFKIDKQLVMKQNVEREYPIPSDVLEKLIDEFQDITKDDERFFDKIYIIEDKNIDSIIEDITK